MLFFTEKGRCYWLNVYEIPEGEKTSKGRAIQNLIQLPGDDKVRAIIDVKDLKDEDFVKSHNIVLCTKKGIIHLIVPPEQFELLCGKDDLMTYTFNTGVAKHTFCKHGIHPFYVPRSDPDKIDVNARCIDDVDLTALTPKSFDGRHWK